MQSMDPSMQSRTRQPVQLLLMPEVRLPLPQGNTILRQAFALHMKTILSSLFYLAILSATAQHTISGSFAPAGDFTWLIAYSLTPGGQDYTTDSRITAGRFTLQLPADTPPGVYRLVYAIPQDTYYLDVIFNGKEDVEFNFESSTGVSFIRSEENKLFHAYFTEITAVEKDIRAAYAANSQKEALPDLAARLLEIQADYEARSQGLLVHRFITANHPYIPAMAESADSYLKHRKEHYFDHLNVNDTLLQVSGYLTDKLISYIYDVSPGSTAANPDSLQHITENIRDIAAKIGDARDEFKIQVYDTLWSRLAKTGNYALSDWVYTDYLQQPALRAGNLKLIEKIEAFNRLRIGQRAPEISWQAGEGTRKLGDLTGADTYILLFWSSECPHCLHELPQLQAALGGKTGIQVLAVGLEDDAENWSRESLRLPSFEHALALGKWESAYAGMYAIEKTPTYFVLDKDKHILSRPEDYQSLMNWLRANSRL